MATRRKQSAKVNIKKKDIQRVTKTNILKAKVVQKRKYKPKIRIRKSLFLRKK